jgi:hypothetical protein
MPSRILYHRDYSHPKTVFTPIGYIITPDTEPATLGPRMRPEDTHYCKSAIDCSTSIYKKAGLRKAKVSGQGGR